MAEVSEKKVDERAAKVSSFVTPLRVEAIDGKRWRLLERFEYITRAGESIVVPVGFVTDFASIPRYVWTLIGHPTGRYGKAAVVHDYLYVLGGRMPDGRVYTRAEADRIFEQGMADLGVRWVKRHAMWLAVRTFGRGNF